MSERKEATEENKQYVRDYCARWKDIIYVDLEGHPDGGINPPNLVPLSKLSPEQYSKKVEEWAFYGDVPITGEIEDWSM